MFITLASKLSAMFHCVPVPCTHVLCVPTTHERSALLDISTHSFLNTAFARTSRGMSFIGVFALNQVIFT
jgi:hypothetical protein